MEAEPRALQAVIDRLANIEHHLHAETGVGDLAEVGKQAEPDCDGSEQQHNLA